MSDLSSLTLFIPIEFYIFYITGNVLTGSREQAFVYSLSSAAIVTYIAKACSLGKLICKKIDNQARIQKLMNRGSYSIR